MSEAFDHHVAEAREEYQQFRNATHMERRNGHAVRATMHANLALMELACDERERSQRFSHPTEGTS